MKKITLLLLLISSSAIAQLKNGDTVPDIQFTTILNAPIKDIKLSQLKGKVVLIEFWATWCGACLEAMPHLKELQNEYANQLQVIAVTDESEKRIGQYLNSRPSNLWMAVDTGGAISKLFPHQLIPHTVLISTDRKLIANTNPEAITGLVIDSILNKKDVQLAEKRDIQVSSEEELINSIFAASDTIKNRFMMQPEIKGAGGFSTTYLTDSAWHGKRITTINCNMSALYRIAYENFPYTRMIDKTLPHDDLPRYCLDIIVDRKQDLLPKMKSELSKRFYLQASVDQQIKEVNVLKIADPKKFKQIPMNRSGVRTYYSRHGEIDQQAITMKEFADYLETFGNGKLLVVDETHATGKFDIKFSFQPENPMSLLNILSDMGLILEKQERKIDMLVLFKQL